MLPEQLQQLRSEIERREKAQLERKLRDPIMAALLAGLRANYQVHSIGYRDSIHKQKAQNNKGTQH